MLSAPRRMALVPSPHPVVPPPSALLLSSRRCIRQREEPNLSCHKRHLAVSFIARGRISSGKVFAFRLDQSRLNCRGRAMSSTSFWPEPHWIPLITNTPCDLGDNTAFPPALAAMMQSPCKTCAGAWRLFANNSGFSLPEIQTTSMDNSARRT